MKYKVRIMSRAKSDICDIRQYITDEYKNPQAARRRVLLIQNKIKSLEENPARFPLVRDDLLASNGFRMIVVETQNVFYAIREKENAVSVMRVLHGRRDWVRILKTDI
ncbi:MAG: type II toxin-antitoxin system RelE/ParE family toxin [Oscillospiraceae bacterium]|nr:type II toxin-antitoxin system RelE/ParE family toxin [Oscillospiraceae bacterium]